MSSNRVTQLDIARKANVHRSTVTLALKNHPGIPKATRDRILKIAQECGYMRDPMLSALAAYSTQMKPATFHGTIAWLVNSKNNWKWNGYEHFFHYFQGAKERARFHGYQIEFFDLNSPGMDPSRIASILAARNISGILMCPQPQPHTEMEFDWDRFSTVTFGYTLLKPKLHTIATTHYANVVQAMRQLRLLGYQRIGYASPQPFEERTDYQCYAGYLMEEDLAGTKKRIPRLVYNWCSYADHFLKWVKLHKLDAVISMDTKIKKTLDVCGLHAPQDLGVACFGFSQLQDKWLAGIVENSLQVGETALDWLVGMIQRGERGIPQIPRRILIEGTWHPGASLRQAKKPAP